MSLSGSDKGPLCYVLMWRWSIGFHEVWWILWPSQWSSVFQIWLWTKESECCNNDQRAGSMQFLHQYYGIYLSLAFWCKIEWLCSRQFGQPVQVGMGVVVQQMVPADSAGVLFTCHPTNRDPRQMLITANFGLGEVWAYNIDEKKDTVKTLSVISDVAI